MHHYTARVIAARPPILSHLNTQEESRLDEWTKILSPKAIVFSFLLVFLLFIVGETYLDILFADVLSKTAVTRHGM